MTKKKMAVIGRRLDSMDQRMGQQDAANRSLLEQLMKIQQDFKVNNSFNSFEDLVEKSHSILSRYS